MENTLNANSLGTVESIVMGIAGTPFEFTPKLFANAALVSIFIYYGWDVTMNLSPADHQRHPAELDHRDRIPDLLLPRPSWPAPGTAASSPRAALDLVTNVVGLGDIAVGAIPLFLNRKKIWRTAAMEGT